MSSAPVTGAERPGVLRLRAELAEGSAPGGTGRAEERAAEATLAAGIAPDRLGPGARAALGRLADGGGTRQELLAVAIAAEGHRAAGAVVAMLAQLADAELLGLAAEIDGRALAIAVPASGEALGRLRDEPRPARARLAADVVVRRDGAALVIETLRDDLRVEVLDPAVLWVVAELARPWAPQLASDVERRVAERVDALLWQSGLTEATAPEPGDGAEVSSAPVPAEQVHSDPVSTDPVSLWEPQDLWLHARSRALGRRRPYGGTHRLRGLVEPLPAFRPRPEGELLTLARPDPAPAPGDDPPFFAVLARRSSQRRFGAQPLALDRLSELLFRTARVRDTFAAEHYQVSRRPYPGGGAVYELELYPVIDRCAGAESGLYHYCPAEHALTRMTGRTPAVEALLDSAAQTAAGERPQVLLVIAARFARIFWKYSAIGYATLLKDVGVLMQTVALAASALEVASCPLGGGSARRFARASGLDPLVEGSVGEMALGSQPAAR